MKKTELRRRARLTANTPLERKTPLQRTVALGRNPLARGHLHANSAAERAQPKRQTASPPRIPTRVRSALAARSGGVCEMRLSGCTWRAVDPAHRVRTGMGGRNGAARVAHHVLSNLIHSCRECHDRTHQNPRLAYALGLMLRDGSDPRSEPVCYRDAWVLLTDDGAVLTAPPSNGAEVAS